MFTRQMMNSSGQVIHADGQSRLQEARCQKRENKAIDAERILFDDPRERRSLLSWQASQPVRHACLEGIVTLNPLLMILSTMTYKSKI